MPIERLVHQPKPRYVAAITNELTDVEGSVGGDTVELKVPGHRAILRVPIEQWNGFVALVDGIGHALVEKATVEGAQVPLPWVPTVTAGAAPEVDPMAEAIVAHMPEGPDDAFSAPPVVEAVEPGTPIPPRVTA